MGVLIDGEWRDDPPRTAKKDGRFERRQVTVRNWITADGSPGPTGTGGFKAEAGRYHLYIAYACPWAHRTLIYRKIKGLEEMIGLSAVHWFMGEKGWEFADGPGVIPDPILNASHLMDIYLAADPSFTGRVTVPVLWDKETHTIVSNESSEIIRMFDSAFIDIAASSPTTYYPEEHRAAIDRLNRHIYENVNNGVYRCGFATTQAAYDTAVGPLFETLDDLEERLADKRFLCGDQPTEADWRLLPTLLRFDLVYHGHFKCNIRRLIDYPNLWDYTRDLYQQPGIAETCNFDHIQKHYYQSHAWVNPTRVVPAGPQLDFDEPANRNHF